MPFIKDPFAGEYDVIKNGEYKGYKYRCVDPYGFWQAKGITGQFTSLSVLQKAIDSEVAAKEARGNRKPHVLEMAAKNNAKAAAAAKEKLD